MCAWKGGEEVDQGCSRTSVLFPLITSDRLGIPRPEGK